MKKNKFWKIAGAIFTMCLMTTCAIGTTFAKYTTGSKASDTARVAKWGVEVSTSGTMFGKFYGANTATENQNSIVAKASGSVDTADAVNGDKVVAPGTMNTTGIQIKIAGQPEVAFDVDADGEVKSEIFLGAGEYGVMIEAFGINAATDFTKEALYTEDDGTYTKATAYDPAVTQYYRLTNYVNVTARYNPIVWTGTVVSTDTEDEPSGDWDKEYATLSEAVEALKSQINALGANDDGTFAANDNVDNVYTLTWAWAFDNKKIAYSDGADTILGDLQAGRSVVKLDGDTATAPVEGADASTADYCLTIDCNIEVTATQVD
jgi:hypothetical protein